MFFICGSLVLFGCDTTGPEPPSTFLHTMLPSDGTVNAEAWARAVVEVPEGGYLLAGVAHTGDRGKDVYVARLKEKGKLRGKRPTAEKVTIRHTISFERGVGTSSSPVSILQISIFFRLMRRAA